MLHEKLSRWRGGEVARIEGLSDAVFAFAVTLLVVSLEVPKTFNELQTAMRGFGSFAVCFVMLMQVWHEQYLFFRRYNLQDSVTVWLNAALLFVVLFYVYPLKFLFTFLINVWTHAGITVRLANGETENMIEGDQVPKLMAIFSAGYLAVSCVFMLLFRRALAKRAELSLTEMEVLETQASLGASAVNAGVGLVSLCIALFGGPAYGSLAGIIYPILLAPSLTIYHSIMGRRKRLLAERLTAARGA